MARSKVAPKPKPIPKIPPGLIQLQTKPKPIEGLEVPRGAMFGYLSARKLMDDAVLRRAYEVSTYAVRVASKDHGKPKLIPYVETVAGNLSQTARISVGAAYVIVSLYALSYNERPI